VPDQPYPHRYGRFVIDCTNAAGVAMAVWDAQRVFIATRDKETMQLMP
jgi:hypothetical protein